MAVLTRYRSMIGAGAVAALVLVLVFGSPWYRDWAAGLDGGTVGGWFAQMLAWPAWSFDLDESVREVFSGLLRALLLIIFAAVLLHLVPGTGTVSTLLGGWAAFLFAAAAAALLAAVIRTDPSLLSTLEAAGDGGRYGLFVGWIVGLASLAGPRR